MLSPLKGLLKELYSVASGHDAAHLKRWLNDPRAEDIYEKICGEQFHKQAAATLIAATLNCRRLAEQSDQLNKDIPALEKKTKALAPKAKKRELKKLANSEISPERFAARRGIIEAIAARAGAKVRDDVVSVRSDEKGTRKRTLFCRFLSLALHDETGQWHDAEVAALCDIAFGGKEISLDMVRSARREQRSRKK
jgi:hypothetical protein